MLTPNELALLFKMMAFLAAAAIVTSHALAAGANP